jgi:hypothetical protein
VHEIRPLAKERERIDLSAATCPIIVGGDKKQVGRGGRFTSAGNSPQSAVRSPKSLDSTVFANSSKSAANIIKVSRLFSDRATVAAKRNWSARLR